MVLRSFLVLMMVVSLGCDSNGGSGGPTGGPSGGDTDIAGGDGVGSDTTAPDGTTGPDGSTTTDTGPGPDDTATTDTGPGPDDTATTDTGPGPDDTTTTDTGPGPDDTTTADTTADAEPTDTTADAEPTDTTADAEPTDTTGDPDTSDTTGDPDTSDAVTSTCGEEPTCACVLSECAAELGLPAETACAVLSSAENLGCLAKLVDVYQAGGCGQSCGGITKTMWVAVCDDAACAGVKGAMAGAGVLTTQCTDCTGGCTPSCGGKACGDDGCGGSCGTCGAGTTCEAGACVAQGGLPTTCDEAHGLPGCCANGDVFWFENGALQGGDGSCGEENNCGWDAVNGYYACGFSGADPSGTYPMECFGTNPAPETCPTCSCAGKTCGDDGCGNSCGSCGAGQFCGSSGQCKAEGALECAKPAGCAEADACACVTCVNDGECTVADDCICPDCAADSYCSNPANCNTDGVCDMYNEGCVCPDCSAHPTCSP
jgi:hypothetical protein